MLLLIIKQLSLQKVQMLKMFKIPLLKIPLHLPDHQGHDLWCRYARRIKGV